MGLKTLKYGVSSWKENIFLDYDNDTVMGVWKKHFITEDKLCHRWNLSK